MLVFQGGKTLCATFCASLIACVCSFSSPEPVVSGYKLNRVTLGTRMVFVCVVLLEFWLRLNEIHEVRTFAPCKGSFFVFVVVFSSLENYFGFRTTNVRVKTDHPSVWGGIKRFEHFQRGLYFSDNCAFDLWVDFVSSASPSFAGLN